MVNYKNLAALGGRGCFEVFKAEPDRSISMFDNDNLNGLIPKKL